MKFNNPPSSFTGPLFQYFGQIAQVLQNLPNVSFFTQQTPNGNVLGVNGDWAIYNGSTSTVSHIWVNQSAATQSATSTGWALVGTNITTTPAFTATVKIQPINDYSLLTTDRFVFDDKAASGRDLTLTLPSSASVDVGAVVWVRINGDSTHLTVVKGTGSQNIEGSVVTIGPDAFKEGYGFLNSGSATTAWYITSADTV